VATISNRAFPQRLIAPMLILVGLALAPSAARALPPPLNPAELSAKSDLVIEGRVAKVWLYSRWLTYLKEGGMGPAGKALLQQAPATDQAMLTLIRNFPYKSWPGLPVAVDGINLAEVKVEKTLKGQAIKVIFIPFIRFHFLTERRLEGPWTEHHYRAGEHLKMHLRQNGPFFESTWWNSVRPLDK
jgi:hypothetical protein